MNASTNKLSRTRLASVLLSVALLAAAAPTIAQNPTAPVACQSTSCGG
ncbi:MAG TPA: hypothetical protein VFP31_01225 [Gaiellaceae bacterium]|nr:hypothetical protein [Gaiellaceae bacterium]